MKNKKFDGQMTIINFGNSKKMLITKVIATVMAILILTTGFSYAQKPPVMKMTTEIPPGITTPDDTKSDSQTHLIF